MVLNINGAYICWAILKQYFNCCTNVHPIDANIHPILSAFICINDYENMVNTGGKKTLSRHISGRFKRTHQKKMDISTAFDC